jgi:predicted nucleotidyltransferase
VTSPTYAEAALPIDGTVSLDQLGIRERIPVSQEQIEAFCRKWKIRELALFGSVLRDDFGADSDVDVLVEFGERAKHTLFDRMQMEEELQTLIGRDVDLVRKDLVVNPYRRRHILDNYQVVYAAP